MRQDMLAAFLQGLLGTCGCDTDGDIPQFHAVVHHALYLL